MNKNDFKWGIGIEHEVHLFHMPKFNNNIIDHLIVYDVESGVNRLLNDYSKKKVNISKSDLEFLKTIPFELSGRMCNGKKIINKIPIKMPELITSYPFCSVDRLPTIKTLEDKFNFKKN